MYIIHNRAQTVHCFVLLFFSFEITIVNFACASLWSERQNVLGTMLLWCIITTGKLSFCGILYLQRSWK